jgi:hypothetical protein
VIFLFFITPEFLSSRLPRTKIKIELYKTVSLPVVLYWSEPWSVALREGCRLTGFEVEVIKKIFKEEEEGTEL